MWYEHLEQWMRWYNWPGSLLRAWMMKAVLTVAISTYRIWSIMLRCLPESNTHPHLGNATYSRQDLILEIDSVLMCLYKWCKQEGDHQHNQHSYYTNRFPATVKLLSVSGVRQYSRQLCGGQGYQCIPHCIPFLLNPL